MNWLEGDLSHLAGDDASESESSMKSEIGSPVLSFLMLRPKVSSSSLTSVSHPCAELKSLIPTRTLCLATG